RRAWPWPARRTHTTARSRLCPTLPPAYRRPPPSPRPTPRRRPRGTPPTPARPRLGQTLDPAYRRPPPAPRPHPRRGPVARTPPPASRRVRGPPAAGLAPCWGGPQTPAAGRSATPRPPPPPAPPPPPPPPASPSPLLRLRPTLAENRPVPHRTTSRWSSPSTSQSSA